MWKREHIRKTQRGLLARSDGEVTWDFQCHGSIRGDSSESGDPDRKRNYARKNPKKSAQKPWLRPENWPLSFTQLIYEYPTCPPDAFIYTKKFIYNNNLNSLIPKDFMEAAGKRLILWNEFEPDK